MAKIYTKKGDKGHSSLFGGKTVSKDDARLEAYGTLDELNSLLGIVRSEGMHQLPALASLDKDLGEIQNYIFTLGSHLASGSAEMKSHLPPLEPSQTSLLEDRIDLMDHQLPPLKNFILPGGSRLAALFHLARTVCRRGERAVVHIGAEVEPEILVYLNRLSDYFFVAARYANAHLGQADVAWRKNPSP